MMMPEQSGGGQAEPASVGSWSSQRGKASENKTDYGQGGWHAEVKRMGQFQGVSTETSIDEARSLEPGTGGKVWEEESKVAGQGVETKAVTALVA